MKATLGEVEVEHRAIHSLGKPAPGPPEKAKEQKTSD